MQGIVCCITIWHQPTDMCFSYLEVRPFERWQAICSPVRVLAYETCMARKSANMYILHVELTFAQGLRVDISVPSRHHIWETTGSISRFTTTVPWNLNQLEMARSTLLFWWVIWPSEIYCYTDNVSRPQRMSLQSPIRGSTIAWLTQLGTYSFLIRSEKDTGSSLVIIGSLTGGPRTLKKKATGRRDAQIMLSTGLVVCSALALWQNKTLYVDNPSW